MVHDESYLISWHDMWDSIQNRHILHWNVDVCIIM